MNVSLADVKALQVLCYFIEEENYKLISIQQATSDFWLANPDKEVPIIRISSRTFSDINNEIAYIGSVRKAIRDIINKDGKVMNISTCINSNELHDESIIDENVSNLNEHSYLFKNYEKLKELIMQLKDEDIQEKFVDLSKKFENLSKSSMKNGRLLKIKTPITNILIAICIIVYFLSTFIITACDNFTVGFIVSGCYYKPFIVAGEYIRLFTSGFLHLDIFHLMVNILTLHQMGKLVENMYTKKKYLSIALISIIVGNLFMLVGGPNQLTLGISGAIFGILGAFLVSLYETKLYRNSFIKVIILKIVFMCVITSMMPGTSLLVHIGSLIGGIFLGIMFGHTDRFNAYKKHVGACLGILCVILFIVGVNSKYIQPQEKKLDAEVLKVYEKYGMKEYADKISNNLDKLYE